MFAAPPVIETTVFARIPETPLARPALALGRVQPDGPEDADLSRGAVLRPRRQSLGHRHPLGPALQDRAGRHRSPSRSNMTASPTGSSSTRTAAPSSPTTRTASWCSIPRPGRSRRLSRPRRRRALQGRQRSRLRLQRRHVFHRSGPDRAARPHRPALSPARQRRARVHPRLHPEPERPGAQQGRDRRLPLRHPRQRDLARAAAEGRQRHQGRRLHSDVRRRRPRRHGDRRGGESRRLPHRLGLASGCSARSASRSIASSPAPASPPPTAPSAGRSGKSLFITESRTGTVLRAELQVPGRRMYSHM